MSHEIPDGLMFLTAMMPCQPLPTVQSGLRLVSFPLGIAEDDFLLCGFAGDVGQPAGWRVFGQWMVLSWGGTVAHSDSYEDASPLFDN